ncbi:MAG: type II toxin-antitoxin system ParD family antitoxin [Bdellovibrionales bacterium]
MNFSIGEHFESFIRQQLSAGHYNSAEEIICDGLRLLEEKEHLQEKLREMIAEGVNSGNYVPAEEVFNRLTTKYQAMANEV